MCAIMHEADPYGHLVINGHALTDAQLSNLVGADKRTVSDHISELESAGVFSKTRIGVIYSRRMTRDDKRRKEGEKAQKKRAVYKIQPPPKCLKNLKKMPNLRGRAQKTLVLISQKPETRKK